MPEAASRRKVTRNSEEKLILSQLLQGAAFSSDVSNESHQEASEQGAPSARLCVLAAAFAGGRAGAGAMALTALET